MDLASFQRRVYRLIREGEEPSRQDPSWMLRMKESGQLDQVREVGRWWTAYQLKDACVLTARLLQREGRWDEALEATVHKGPAHHYVPDIMTRFLGELYEAEPDTMLGTVAGFEHAMTKVKMGDARRYEINWKANPIEVLGAILEDEPLPRWGEGHFQTVVSAEWPELFKAYELE